MTYKEAIDEAKAISRQERINSGRVYENNEGVWVEVYLDSDGEYNLDEKGEKVCAIEATKWSFNTHRY